MGTVCVRERQVEAHQPGHLDGTSQLFLQLGIAMSSAHVFPHTLL